jgi:hypothetical protein
MAVVYIPRQSVELVVERVEVGLEEGERNQREGLEAARNERVTRLTRWNHLAIGGDWLSPVACRFAMNGDG